MTPCTSPSRGQTLAFDSANLFARSTGYVAERMVDIGSRVKKGELLPRISAPDLDQQLVQAQAQVGQNEAALLQAQANLQQVQANVGLANITKYRETTLANQGWETKQNADNSVANAQTTAAAVRSAQAASRWLQRNLRAQQATVQRLQALTAFERVTAPFDGVVTRAQCGQWRFAYRRQRRWHAAANRGARRHPGISVYVPQSDAVGIRDGLAAEVTVPELPGRGFQAHVSRVADALDQSARAMRTEVDIDNRDGALRPGLFVNVTFQIPRERPGVVVPDEALVFNAGGLQVATVADGKIAFRKVAIYRDLGTTAEVRDGLSGGETLVLQPPTDLANGGKVSIADEQQPTTEREAAARGTGDQASNAGDRF